MNTSVENRTKSRHLLISVLMAMGLTLAILLIVYWREKILWFGPNSVASIDGDIQYGDFFVYLQKCLKGQESFAYSMHKGLGGAMIGLVSYYLISPFNWLVLLFKPDQMAQFIDVLFLLKMVCGAGAMSWFLNKRFPEIPCFVAVCLSACYALMQYSWSQSSNIIWLDVIYMLPFMMYGVHLIISKNKWIPLSVSFGLMVLFNWYVAGMSGLFLGFWFIFECISSLVIKTLSFRGCIGRTFRFVGAMLLGLGLSAVLFLPTAITVMQGKGTEFAKEMLFDFSRHAGFRAFPQNYVIGAVCDWWVPALYCGSLPIIGTAGYFCSSKISWKQRLISFVMLVFFLLPYMVVAFFIVFNLVRNPDYYFFRFGFFLPFVLCTLAGSYFTVAPVRKKTGLLCLGISIVASAAIFYYSYRYAGTTKLHVIATVVLFILNGLFLYFYYAPDKFKLVCSVLVALCTITELSWNGSEVLKAFMTTEGPERNAAYYKEMNTLLSALPDGDYRIGQTIYRDTQRLTRATPYLNDSISFGFSSTGIYASTTENKQLDLLDRVGYRLNAATVNSVNTSILPIDSLLGVRYLFSDFDIKGLEKIQEGPVLKDIYENPYALPMAFTTAPDLEQTETWEKLNGFEFQNAIFKSLSGLDKDVFYPVEYIKIPNARLRIQEYRLSIPNDTDPVYGNLPDDSTVEGDIWIDGHHLCAYNMWVASDVFYIPQHGQETVRVTLKSGLPVKIKKPEFYAVDLDVLAEMKEKILDMDSVTSMDLENGYMSFETDSTSESTLFTSIPNIAGWSATINGEPAEIEEYADAFISLQLPAGNNVIEFHYHIPGMLAGCAVSIVSLGILVFFCIRERRKSHVVNRASSL